MLPVESSSFYQDVAAFAKNHKVLCILTLGLAVVGYSLGNLAGRAVSWIYEYGGTTKKTSEVGLAHISNSRTTGDSANFSSKMQNSAERPLISNLNRAPHLTGEELPQLTKNLLSAYNTHQEGWVMVPPKDEIQIDKPFVIGSGAIGFKGNGRWKIHVSIDPQQMEQAIPIFMEVLHSPEAPRLGFKMQTKANLDSVHQIGKEFAIIFDEEVEASAIRGNMHDVEKCLSKLWKRLYDAGIRPEPGFVLTPQTMEMVKTAPDGKQTKEKENLEIGKFDRAIPCPKNCNFFYYRDENFVPVQDAEFAQLEEEFRQGIFAASYLIDLARQRPDLAHNPTQSDDPFLHLQIQEH